VASFYGHGVCILTYRIHIGLHVSLCTLRYLVFHHKCRSTMRKTDMADRLQTTQRFKFKINAIIVSSRCLPIDLQTAEYRDGDLAIPVIGQTYGRRY